MHSHDSMFGDHVHSRWPLFVGSAIVWLSCVTAALGSEEKAADPLRRQVKQLYHGYVAGFGSPSTGLVYHHRLDGPRGVEALSSPAEVAAGTVNGRPVPYGYGSGIQDVALENGQLLYALCEAFEATGDRELGDWARSIFEGLSRAATLSPEPGFVPRGPHPDGVSYYKDSSRDQHAAMAEALWRYSRCRLATAEDRRFVAGELDEMARRFVRNDWKIMVEDSSHVAHVGFSWRQSTPVGAVSLLSFLAMTADATDDPHWRQLYAQYSDEDDSKRWSTLLHPEAVKTWKPFTLYSNQFAQALAVLRECESDTRRSDQISDLLTSLSRRAVESDVFDTTYWRRLDWAGDADDRETAAWLKPLGLSLSRPSTVADLLDSFDPSWFTGGDSPAHYVGAKLCFGIPTAAFHKAILSGDEELIESVAPHVRRMVEIMLAAGQDYTHGENYNRTVVLGLLLVAAQADGTKSTEPAPEPRVEPSGPEEDASTPVELPIIGNLGIGSAMDVAVAGGMLYVIGGGRLHVAELANPRSPKVVGRLEGLGYVRQICVRRNIAYVTSREDGLFLIDVSEPSGPKLLAHYDTIELATGIAISGDVAFVACRTAGVELIDVSDPSRPAHLSTVRTGEAQSVYARDGVLYAGVWAVSKLVICDVTNPRKPSIIAEAELDGFGDGVYVHGNYCYAATGHHSHLRPRDKDGDPGFGRGHGLEIFDVTDPAQPKHVSRIKFPPLYRMGMDMWGVTRSGDYAFVADTYNGLFVVDVSDPRSPRIVARRQLAVVAERGDPSPVAGLAVGDGVIYAAGAWSDLHVVEAPMASPVEPEADTPPQIPAQPDDRPDPRFRVFTPAGQVHAVALDGDVALVAAGNDGLHAVRLDPEIRKLASYPTEGIAFDVAVSGRRVFVAEGSEGLSIFTHKGDGKLAPEGRYATNGQPVRQVVVPPPGDFALLHVGPGKLHVVDVRKPDRPANVLTDSHHGLFYCWPLALGLLDGRYTCCHWHVSGLHWYDMSGASPTPTGESYPFRIGSRNGVAFVGDRALATCRGGYALLSRSENREPGRLDIHRLPDTYVSGKPTIDGNTLFVSDRNGGVITAIDISDLASPKLIDRVELTGHPGLVRTHNGKPIIPGGYQGLLVWESCGSK